MVTGKNHPEKITSDNISRKEYPMDIITYVKITIGKNHQLKKSPSERIPKFQIKQFDIYCQVYKKRVTIVC